MTVFAALLVVIGVLFIARMLWRIGADERAEWTEWTEQDQTAYEVYTEWMSER